MQLPRRAVHMEAAQSLLLFQVGTSTGPMIDVYGCTHSGVFDLWSAMRAQVEWLEKHCRAEQSRTSLIDHEAASVPTLPISAWTMFFFYGTGYPPGTSTSNCTYIYTS